VKEQLSGPFGWPAGSFDLLYSGGEESKGRVLPDAELVFEAGIEDGCRVIVHNRNGDEARPLAADRTDPWEQAVFELVSHRELETLRAGTREAKDIDLIIASLVHGGSLRGMGGM
jgi:hypothetical protein